MGGADIVCTCHCLAHLHRQGRLRSPQGAHVNIVGFLDPHHAGKSMTRWSYYGYLGRLPAFNPVPAGRDVGNMDSRPAQFSAEHLQAKSVPSLTGDIPARRQPRADAPFTARWASPPRIWQAGSHHVFDPGPRREGRGITSPFDKGSFRETSTSS